MELNSRASGILASLGIILITGGLVAFLLQGWNIMSVTAILACIWGYGAITYALSLYIVSKKNYPAISNTLLITSVGMIIWGIEAYSGFRIYSDTQFLKLVRIFDSVVVITLCAVSWYIGRQVVALTGTIIATQALYLSSMAFIFYAYFPFYIIKFGFNGIVVAMMLIGFSYAVKQLSSSLSYWLRLVGSILMGISLYILGEWTLWGRTHVFSYEEVMWQLCWPIIGIMLVYLGLRLRDNAFFIGGMASIIGVIFSVATTYARSMLGLPVTLVLFGTISIGLSYAMLHLKNKVY